MSEILKTLRGLKDRVVKWWREAHPKQRVALGVGVGVLGVSFLVGGVFIQAAVGAGITVGLLGMEFHDSPWVGRFMRKHGKKLDMALTIVGVIAGPGGGITAILFGFLLGGFFTIMRLLLWPEEVVVAAEAKEAEGHVCAKCGAKEEAA